MSIILGIDPGTTTVGFAVIEKSGRNVSILNYGVITTPPKISIALKLQDITKDLEDLINTYHPTVCGIEKLFFFNNQKTGIDVAQARGAILLTLQKKGIQIYEFTPLQVKRGISGNGSAKKEQVQNALKIIFKLETIPKPDDAADAIAIAYLASLQKNRL
ncbi:MAG: crossover junction endodeoxyribonuclease RuvC [Candidatus Gracilibacteria bacterium]|nr:crossover junction endodeoxyribonuclease RuvC [Candidatus Gracilibacteria bacterium]